MVRELKIEVTRVNPETENSRKRLEYYKEQFEKAGRKNRNV